MKIYDNAVREFPSNAALDLVPLPEESMVSSIWRFAWRNGLGVKELLTHCTHGAGYQKEHATFSYKRGFDPDVFSHSSWWIDEPSEKEVFGSSSEKHRSIWWNTAFRYCPLCLGHLYHSFWHQSKFLSHCPLDGAALRDTCYSCGKHLPTYGFHQEILSRPYVCPHCNGPISGVGLSVDARLEIQQSKREYARAFESLDHWWEESTAVRNQLESFLSSRAYHFSPWLRPETTWLQWVIHQVPPPATLPFTTREVPQLVVLTWKIALKRCDPMKSVLFPKRWKTEKLSLAIKVYRATLRRLLRVIAESEPFDDEDYVRHRAESIKDLLNSPSGCNMKLLAFIMLRNSYETYFSVMHASPDQADFQDWNVGFPYGNEFAQRVRICWRAQFIAEYAAFYWWLVAVRDGRKRVGDFRRETATMSHVDVKFDGSNGDYIIGKVAFPAVDGLRLSLSP